MKSTLADNKQLFNVKALAAAGLDPNAMPDGQFGIVDASTGLTVVPAFFNALPAKFLFVSKLDGKVYYSFDEIEKATIKNKIAKDYTAPKQNIWKGEVGGGCGCINGATLTVNIEDMSLIMRDGLTWTHRDMFYQVAPEEINCFCDDGTKNPVYENNVLTMLLAQKVNESNSPFYYAEVENAGVVVGDVPAFVKANKAVNTDANAANDGAKLTLVLKSKVLPTPAFDTFNATYLYTRGTRIVPALAVDGTAIKFTETQAMAYEIGAGYDLRAEEWENMNYYTNLNGFAQLSDGLPSGLVKYQFENATNYDTLTFEFYTDKVERNNGDKRLFGVLLGVKDGNAAFATLKTIFGV